MRCGNSALNLEECQALRVLTLSSWWDKAGLIYFLALFKVHNWLLLGSSIDPLRCEKMKYPKILAHIGLKYVFSKVYVILPYVDLILFIADTRSGIL